MYGSTLPKTGLALGAIGAYAVGGLAAVGIGVGLILFAALGLRLSGKLRGR